MRYDIFKMDVKIPTALTTGPIAHTISPSDFYAFFPMTEAINPFTTAVVVLSVIKRVLPIRT